MATGSPHQADRIFRFGPFELSEQEGELRKNGVRVKLQEQPFRVLLELVANPGKVVSREELQQKLWPADTFVDFDTGVNTAIRKLRQALNDDADNPHYIETLARRGYRFIAQVADGGPAQPGAEPAPLSAQPAATVMVAATGPMADYSSATETAVGEGTIWRSKLRLWQLVVAGVALLAVSVGIAWWMRPAAQREVTAQRITANPADVPVTGAVISPDGKYVAYSDPTGVYIRHIDSGETQPADAAQGIQWYPHQLVSRQHAPASQHP